MGKIKEISESIKNLYDCTLRIDKNVAVLSTELSHVKRSNVKHEIALKEHTDTDMLWHESIEKKLNNICPTSGVQNQLEQLKENDNRLEQYDISQNGKIDEVNKNMEELSNKIENIYTKISTYGKVIMILIAIAGVLISALNLFYNKTKTVIKHDDVKNAIETQIMPKLEKLIEEGRN